MAVPVLNDYTYQYKDNGILLNGVWDATYPGFIDVDKVTGLDLPEFELASNDLDGQHGSITYVQYSRGRIIVVECTAYTDPATADVFIEKVIANYIPDNLDWPFYYKGAGIAQRYISGKPISCKFDTDTLRRIGSCKLQLQLQCDDPYKKINNADQTMVLETSYTIANTGTVQSYPIVTITGAYTNLSLTNNTTGKVVTLNRTSVLGDVTVVNFRNKSVTVNGVVGSSAMTGNWWTISPGGNSIKATTTSGTPTSVVAVTYSGWL